MKYHSVFTVLILSLFWLSSHAETFDDSAFAHIDYPAWFSQNPFNDLSEVLAESNTKGKKGGIRLIYNRSANPPANG